MTDITVRIGRYMVCCFTRGYCAVMTGGTVASHFIVIYFGGRGPAISAVAGITGITGLNVFRAFAFGCRAIMTT